MSADWHYAKGNDKHGPFSSSELKQLAREGTLQPTHLVWKEGMPDWKPASRIKGLFDDSPQTAPPPPLPATPSTTKGDSTQPPDVGTAARDFFAAASARARDLGKRAADTAREYQEKLQKQTDSSTPKADTSAAGDSAAVTSAGDTDTSSSTRAPTPKWVMWTAGGGCLSILTMCLLLAVFGIFLDSFGLNSRLTASGFTSKDGTAGYVMSPSDLPPPVTQSIKDGKDVWQLSGYRESDDGRTLYIILDGDRLENLVPVTHISKSSAARFYGEANAPDQDVYNWGLHSPVYDNEGATGKTRFEWNWTLTTSGNVWTLTKTQRVEVEPSIVITEITIDITLDEKTGGGFWQMSRTDHTKYQGSMARFPDETETERSEGDFWPVPRS